MSAQSQHVLSRAKPHMTGERQKDSIHFVQLSVICGKTSRCNRLIKPHERASRFPLISASDFIRAILFLRFNLLSKPGPRSMIYEGADPRTMTILLQS